jgi:hypothetical protein
MQLAQVALQEAARKKARREELQRQQAQAQQRGRQQDMDQQQARRQHKGLNCALDELIKVTNPVAWVLCTPARAGGLQLGVCEPVPRLTVH